MPRSDDATERLRRRFEGPYLSLHLGIAAIGALLPAAHRIGARVLEARA